MSRDFKQEYQEHMNKQTPDLWDRIEAGLTDKKVSVPAGKDVSTGGNEAMQDVCVRQKETTRLRKKRAVRWTDYGLAVAAVLLIGVSVSAFYMGLDGTMFGGKDSSMDMAVAQDNGSAGRVEGELNDAAMPEEISDFLADTAAGCEAAGELDGVQEEEKKADKESAVETTEKLQQEYSNGTSSGSQGSHQDLLADSQQEPESMQDSTEDMGMLRTVMLNVMILDGLESDREDMRFYLAQVDGQEESVVLAFPTELQMEPEAGQTYRLQAVGEEETADGKYDYRVVAVE